MSPSQPKSLSWTPLYQSSRLRSRAVTSSSWLATSTSDVDRYYGWSEMGDGQSAQHGIEHPDDKHNRVCNGSSRHMADHVSMVISLARLWNSGASAIASRRHVARIWPREGRRREESQGLLSTESLFSKGASSLQRASSVHRASSLQKAPF